MVEFKSIKYVFYLMFCRYLQNSGNIKTMLTVSGHGLYKILMISIWIECVCLQGCQVVLRNYKYTLNSDVATLPKEGRQTFFSYNCKSWSF